MAILTLKTRLRAYYYLTKPGIIYGNIMTAAAGFLLAAKGHINILLLLVTLAGTSLIIASACVFNNYIDRDIDKKMARTKKRALVSGNISARNALVYASALGLTGGAILGYRVNGLVLGIGLVGFVSYVGLYTYAKRKTLWGTEIGSISGATPIIAGYCAVTNNIDTGAVLLFLIMVLWQMPHFYAIAIYRLDDYSKAKIPVLPAVKGILATKARMTTYIAFYFLAAYLLFATGYANTWTYLLVMGGLCAYWLRLALQGRQAADDAVWARKLFFFSLKVLLMFCLLLATNSLL